MLDHRDHCRTVGAIYHPEVIGKVFDLPVVGDTWTDPRAGDTQVIVGISTRGTDIVLLLADGSTAEIGLEDLREVSLPPA